MINPKNSENALKMFQTEFETKHVISEKADMTEVDIKNKLTVNGSFALGGAARDFGNHDALLVERAMGAATCSSLPSSKRKGFSSELKNG